MAEAGKICWVLSDGRRGMENQCLGIAEALAERLPSLEIIRKEIHPNAPWRWLPESLAGRPWPLPFMALGRDSDVLKAPWPDYLIACGRMTVAYSAAIRRLAGGRTFVVQTQDPRLSPKFFDLVVPPLHDGLEGANVFAIQGSPNRVSAEQLKKGAEDFAATFVDLPRPLIAVVIGGDSRHFQLTSHKAEAISKDLKTLMDEGFGLMVTTSRRTSPEAETILRVALDQSACSFWDGKGENPYFGMLGLADHILVTEESTNMVTEAAATGRPVHVLKLEGQSDKFARFNSDMTRAGITRPFALPLESWSYPPLAETGRVAEEILRRSH